MNNGRYIEWFFYRFSLVDSRELICSAFPPFRLPHELSSKLKQKRKYCFSWPCQIAHDMSLLFICSEIAVLSYIYNYLCEYKFHFSKKKKKRVTRLTLICRSSFLDWLNWLTFRRLSIQQVHLLNVACIRLCKTRKFITDTSNSHIGPRIWLRRS